MDMEFNLNINLTYSVAASDCSGKTAGSIAGGSGRLVIINN